MSNPLERTRLKDRSSAIAVSFLLVAVAIAIVIYLPLDNPYVHLDDFGRQGVPDTLFEFAVTTLILSTLGFAWKTHTEEQDKRLAEYEAERAAQRELDREKRDALIKFRRDIIGVYIGFKAVRREMRALADFEEGKDVRIRKTDFFRLFSRFNTLQHEVEALDWALYISQRFLGEDQRLIHSYIRTIEEFTGEVGRDARRFDCLDPDGCLTIARGTWVWEFLQGSFKTGIEDDANADYPVLEGFFDPMLRIRQTIQARISIYNEDGEELPEIHKFRGPRVFDEPDKETEAALD